MMPIPNTKHSTSTGPKVIKHSTNSINFCQNVVGCNTYQNPIDNNIGATDMILPINTKSAFFIIFIYAPILEVRVGFLCYEF